MSKLLTALRFLVWVIAIIATTDSFASSTGTCENIFANTSQSGFPNGHGANFLKERFPQLQTSRRVQRANTNNLGLPTNRSNKPQAKIAAWLKDLDRLFENAPKNPRVIQQMKEIAYTHYVIAAEQIPQSYYDTQVNLARERGQGNINLTESMKTELQKLVINEQIESLDKWIDYLLSPDAAVYPSWAKYWMFTGLTKLSKFQPGANTFGNRTSQTVAPFPEVNREALAYVFDSLVQKVEENELTDPSDNAFRQLLDGANFGKLYAHALIKAGFGSSRFFSNEGEWVVYKQNSDPAPLVKSLQGRQTGWCTAGTRTAKSQLSQGDFHVFYSQDAEGKAVVPRLAIRMANSRIAEVRGVNKNQNIDPSIEAAGVLSKKLESFGEEQSRYAKKESDMRKLTEVDRKTRLGSPLSADELRFLYEWDFPIEGFGHRKDPRIDEIRKQRDSAADYALFLEGGYRPDQISAGKKMTKKELLTSNVKVRIGDLDLLKYKVDPRAIVLPEIFVGALYGFTGESASGLKLPRMFRGSLYLQNLKSAEGVEFPSSFKGFLNLSNLTSADGLKLPEDFNADVYLNGLTDASNLEFPKKFTGSISFANLRSALGLELPENFKGRLMFHKLKSAEGLKIPAHFDGSLTLYGLKSPKHLELPASFVGTVDLLDIVSARGLIVPESFAGRILLRSITGLKLPRSFKGEIWVAEGSRYVPVEPANFIK